MFARAGDDIINLPGLEPGTRHYFRDVYDHLIRISDLIDSYRDLLTGAMDVYLSTVSNRLNVVMKQLTGSPRSSCRSRSSPDSSGRTSGGWSSRSTRSPRS